MTQTLQLRNGQGTPISMLRSINANGQQTQEEILSATIRQQNESKSYNEVLSLPSHYGYHSTHTHTHTKPKNPPTNI